jgi:hypothetical protein
MLHWFSDTEHHTAHIGTVLSFEKIHWSCGIQESCGILVTRKKGAYIPLMHGGSFRRKAAPSGRACVAQQQQSLSVVRVDHASNCHCTMFVVMSTMRNRYDRMVSIAQHQHAC